MIHQAFYYVCLTAYKKSNKLNTSMHFYGKEFLKVFLEYSANIMNWIWFFFNLISKQKQTHRNAQMFNFH